MFFTRASSAMRATVSKISLPFLAETSIFQLRNRSFSPLVYLFQQQKWLSVENILPNTHQTSETLDVPKFPPPGQDPDPRRERPNQAGTGENESGTEAELLGTFFH